MKQSIMPSKIEQRVSKKGDNFLVVQAGKDSYSVWDAPLFDFLEVNKAIEVEVKVNGKYKNIVQIYNDIPKVEVKIADKVLARLDEIDDKLDEITAMLVKPDQNG